MKNIIKKLNKKVIFAIFSYYKYLILKYFNIVNIEIIDILAQQRLNVCKTCPLYLYLEKDEELNGLRNNSYICNPNKDIDGIKGCGCTLYSENKLVPQKIYSIDNNSKSTCPFNKWKDVDSLFLVLDNSEQINKKELEKLGVILYAEKYNLKIKLNA